MRIILFFLLTVFSLKIVLANNNNVLTKTVLFENSSIQTFIDSRCKNFTDEVVATEMRNRLKSFDAYFEKLEEKKDIFCPDTYKLIPMMKEYTTDLKSCFQSPNETYFPNFMLEGFAAFIEFLCTNRTMEIFFSEQGTDCRNALREYQDGEEVKNCSCQLFKRFHDDVLTYEDLCFELSAAEKCFGDAIDHGCPYFVAFKMLNSKFFRAVGTLCNSSGIFHIAGFVLMMSGILSLCNLIFFN